MYNRIEFIFTLQSSEVGEINRQPLWEPRFRNSVPRVPVPPVKSIALIDELGIFFIFRKTGGSFIFFGND